MNQKETQLVVKYTVEDQILLSTNSDIKIQRPSVCVKKCS